MQNLAMGQNTATSSDDPTNLRCRFKLGAQQIGGVNYAFLLLAVLCQAATILITWDVWQVRGLETAIPNLPWFATPPQFDFAWLLLASLVLTLVSPRHFGFYVYLLCLILAIATDQLRCQPQLISISACMAACIFPAAKQFCVWYLIAMWVWAGLHKLLSPDWYGEATYYMLLRQQIQWEATRWVDHHALLATVVALAELGLGVLACRRPRTASPFCFLMHAGIATFLIVTNWNFSVLPWNCCTATVGVWLLWTTNDNASPVSLPKPTAGKLAVAMILLSPIGSKVYEAITDLRVPFPHEPKAFIDLFQLTGKPGEKLHIREYRPWVPSRYFRMNQQQTVVEISRDEFIDGSGEMIPGILFDDRRKRFQLIKEFRSANLGLEADDQSRANIVKRSRHEMVSAIKFTPNKDRKQSYEMIEGLPNLELIQLSGSNITDDELRHLSGALRLRRIGLSDTAITNEGLRSSSPIPVLPVSDSQNDGLAVDGTQLNGFVHRKRQKNCNSIHRLASQNMNC